MTLPAVVTLTQDEARRLADCEAVIERGIKTFVDVGNALAEVRDDRLYRGTHGTFEDYCRDTWGFVQQHATRLIRAAEVIRNIQSEPIGSLFPTTESQARPLTRLEPAEQAAAWQEAVSTAPNGKVTAAHVDATVKRIARQEKEEYRRERDAAAIERVQAMSGNGYRLIQGDFREVAADILDGSIDLILTDPPYPAEYIYLFDDLALLAGRVLKPGGLLAAMVGQLYLPQYIERLSSQLTYHWTLAYLTLGGQSPQIWPKRINTFWKPILVFSNGKYDGDWIGDVSRSDNNDKRFHKWGQSESGMFDLIDRLSKPGDTVLDPFCGGGTTGLAAIVSHRLFIGIDNDPSAIQTAANRLELCNQ